MGSLLLTSIHVHVLQMHISLAQIHNLIHVHLYMQLVASMDVNATVYSADTRIQECRKVRFAVLYVHVYACIYIYVYEILPMNDNKSTLASTYSHVGMALTCPLALTNETAQIDSYKPFQTHSMAYECFYTQ